MRDRLYELADDKSDWTAMFRLFGRQRREINSQLAGELSVLYADGR